MSRLALLGGSPLRTAPWPRWPARSEEEERAVLAALRDGDWGGFPLPNERSAHFAEAFARRHDSRFALPVTNGTVSLEVALQALGVEPGGEVIVPAYTFEATASAVLFAGAVPVLADVEPDTYCLSPAAVESVITPQTQAIVPVHLAMVIADMDSLNDIAARHGLAVLEDCAHAHGARWKGRAVGALGNAGSFSFQTSKLMTAGEGGIVTTDDEAVLDRLHALVNCGRQRPGRERDVPVVGHNYRMTDLQAAILEVQLGRLDEQHERRARNAARLAAGLREISGLVPLRVDERITTQAIYQYVLRYDAEAWDGLPRDRFVAALAAEGVPCEGVFYENLADSPLLPLDAQRYPAWAAAYERRADCPVARRAAYQESVWLSHHLLLGEGSDVDDILAAIRKVYDARHELLRAEHPEFGRRAKARTRRD
ncbi:MAG TPA: DegT/DnrJ/EryC1/StrS family aminotransferase [Thermoanaerobaculia bacterium]|nr:DegT/DnrJ/EryC1/StrS family aminotransferase [Thermoanaerobaculia bacterium]